MDERRGSSRRGASSYGEDPFTAAAPFTSGRYPAPGSATGTSSSVAPSASALTDHPDRGDITFDWRHDRHRNKFQGAYASTRVAPLRQHSQWNRRESFLKLSSAVGLVNGYFDILPRGCSRLTSVQASASSTIGFALPTDSESRSRRLGSPPNRHRGALAHALGRQRQTDVGLAAALMAGISFSFDQRWAARCRLPRAQYLAAAPPRSRAHSVPLRPNAGAARAPRVTIGSTRCASACASTSGEDFSLSPGLLHRRGSG